MALTRRDFVRHSGLAAAAWVPAHAQQPAPAPAAGVIPLEVSLTLMACAEAVTGVRPLRGHYRQYWDQQALHRQGRAELYARFAAAVRAAALSAGLSDFAGADLPPRVAVLDTLRAQPDAARDFEVAVFQEIIAVFQRTDAWLQLGYESWPGSPRGLDAYRRPPASLAPR